MQAERDCVGYAITDSFPKKHQIGSAVPNWQSKSSDTIDICKCARSDTSASIHFEYLSKYIETVKQLREQFPLPIGIIASESQQKNFINLMGKILRLRNILTAYDDFETDDIMSPRELKTNEGGDREIPVEISRALAASPSLRGKRDLIEEFYHWVFA